MRALIVDDEEPAREEMRWLLEQCAGVEVVGTAREFEEVRAYFSGDGESDIEQTDVDVVLLDIDMPGPDGVRVAEWLETSDAAVVFVTAYEEYAVDAFGVDAVDYLLKPVRLERLEQTLERVRRRLDRDDGGARRDEGAASEEAEPSAAPPPLERLSVRSVSGESACDDSFRVIDLEDVAYLEADEGQVAVQTDDGERFRADFRLKDLAGRLDDAGFFRCHRSYVVRVSAIEAIEPQGDGRYRLVIDRKEDRAIPLARSRASQLKRRMPWSAHLLDEET